MWKACNILEYADGYGNGKMFHYNIKEGSAVCELLKYVYPD